MTVAINYKLLTINYYQNFVMNSTTILSFLKL